MEPKGQDMSQSTEQEAGKEKLPYPVYFVESPEDDTVVVAMDVVVEPDMVTWFDTIKERKMRIGQIIDNDPAHFVFERTELGDGQIQTYTFVPMNLENYNSKVKQHLIDPKDEDSQDENSLIAAFLETKKHAW